MRYIVFWVGDNQLGIAASCEQWVDAVKYIVRYECDYIFDKQTDKIARRYDEEVENTERDFAWHIKGLKRDYVGKME